MTESPPQQPLLFQVSPRPCPPVRHDRACSTASRIFSATSRLGRSGSLTGSPCFGTIVTRFVETSNPAPGSSASRSEEHTSELQSPCNLVCRLLLEKKKKKDARSTVYGM